MRRSKRTPFFWIWWATFVSAVGSGMQTGALPLLAIEYTRDPMEIAGISAAASIAMPLAGFAGVVIDRLDARRFYVVMDLSRGVCVTAFTISLLLGACNLYAIYALSLVLGAGVLFESQVSRRVVLQFVPGQQLIQANSQLTIGNTVGRTIVGRSLAGVTYALASVIPFAVDAVSFFSSAALISRLPPTPPSTDAKRTVLSQLGAAIAAIWRIRPLRAFNGIYAVNQVVTGAVDAVLVLYAVEVLKVGPSGFGLLVAVGVLGALGAGWVTPRLTRVLTPGRAYLLAHALGSVFLLSLAFTTNAFIAAPALTMLTGSFVTRRIISVTEQQRLLNRSLFSTAVGLMTLLTVLRFPSALGFGAVVETLGFQRGFILLAALSAVPLVTAFAPLWRDYAAASPSCDESA